MQSIPSFYGQSPFQDFTSNDKQSKTNKTQFFKNNSKDKDTFSKNNPPVQQVKLNNWQKAVVVAQCGIATGIVGSATAALLFYKLFKNKLANPIDTAKTFQNIYEDLSACKNLSEISLPKSLSDTKDAIIKQLEHPQKIADRGGSACRSMLLYGPPGTGKTTFAKAITKEIPNAQFVSLDVSRMKDKFYGQTEKNLNALIDRVCLDASIMQEHYNSQLAQIIGEDVINSGDNQLIQNAIAHAKKQGFDIPQQGKIIVFIDEIDSVMMVDNSSSSKFSNDVLNEFKKGFTDKLAKHDNIITIGATNLEINQNRAFFDGKALDSAMLDRFALKVNVPSPDKKQIQETILNNYSHSLYVDDELKHYNPHLEIISNFLADNQISFRTLNGIFQQTAARTALSDSNVSIREFVKTINNMSEELNLNPSDISTLCSNLKLNPSSLSS